MRRHPYRNCYCCCNSRDEGWTADGRTGAVSVDGTSKHVSVLVLDLGPELHSVLKCSSATTRSRVLICIDFPALSLPSFLFILVSISSFAPREHSHRQLHAYPSRAQSTKSSLRNRCPRWAACENRRIYHTSSISALRFYAARAIRSQSSP